MQEKVTLTCELSRTCAGSTQGIGLGMLEGLARAARRGDAKRIFLDVAEDNEAARALYHKLGFVEVGRRKRYYQRVGAEPVDALTLAWTL